MPEFTYEESLEESSHNPIRYEMPAGINWSDDIKALLEAHEAALTAADDAQVALWDAQEDYLKAIEQDRVEFREAVKSGGKDPGPGRAPAALRALQFATERSRMLREAADRTVGVDAGGHDKIRALIKRDAAEYMWQALGQLEHYATIYGATLSRIREDHYRDLSNMRVAFNVLRAFNDLQDVVSFGLPDPQPNISWPQFNYLGAIKQLREQLEIHAPQIEKRQSRVFPDIAGITGSNLPQKEK